MEAIFGPFGVFGMGFLGAQGAEGSWKVSVTILGRRKDLCLAGLAGLYIISEFSWFKHGSWISGEKRSFPPSNRMGLLAPGRFVGGAFFLTVPDSGSSLDKVSYRRELNFNVGGSSSSSMHVDSKRLQLGSPEGSVMSPTHSSATTEAPT